jgi:hypothetical protein
MRGYELLNRWRELAPYQRDQCIQFFTGSAMSPLDGFKDHPEKDMAAYAVSEFEKALQYAKGQPENETRKEPKIDFKVEGSTRFSDSLRSFYLQAINMPHEAFYGELKNFTPIRAFPFDEKMKDCHTTNYSEYAYGDGME